MPLKAIVPSADEIVLANLPFKQAKKKKAYMGKRISKK